MRLRLIPLVIFAAALLLSVRMGGLYVEVGDAVAETAPGKPIDLTSGMKSAAAGSRRQGQGGGREAHAPPKPVPSKTATAKAEPPKPAPAEKAPAAKPAAEAAPQPAMPGKPAADAPPTKAAEAPPPKPAARSPVGRAGRRGQARRRGGRAPPEKAPGAASVDATPPRPTLPRKPIKDEALPDPDDMSRGDLKILQELAQRRRELDQRDQDLAMRDGLLKAAEKRVDEKIAELAKMKAQLEALVKQREEQQNVQLKSLVKIYENMKPKDAAQIFDQLDMTILVELLAHMKENKSAPIMAAMDPKRVKDVTARLINRRSLGPDAQAEGQKTAAR